MTSLDDLVGTLEVLRFNEAQTASLGLAYRGPADFVLRHGESFEPRPLPDEYEYGAPKACYGNAIVLAATRGLGYVEGYARGPFGLAIPHAWNTDDEGRLIDVTWSAIFDDGVRAAIPDSAYLGVRFSLGRADDATWNGDGSVLDDWKRRWPLLREPWTGENWEREWEPTEALRALLSRDKVAARRLIARERL